MTETNGEQSDKKCSPSSKRFANPPHKVVVWDVLSLKLSQRVGLIMVLLCVLTLLYGGDSDCGRQQKALKRWDTTISGKVKYANASLVVQDHEYSRFLRYPDDIDMRQSNPNTHSTAVTYPVTLHVVHQGQKKGLASTHRTHGFPDTSTVKPNLQANGFEFVDMSSLFPRGLIENLARRGGSLTIEERMTIYNTLSGAFLQMESSSGSSSSSSSPSSLQLGGVIRQFRQWFGFDRLPQWLLFLYIAPDGLTTRAVGPGPTFVDGITSSPWNGMVHVDQDPYGMPIRRILAGAAPLLFHESSPLELLNIWIPTQPIVCQPLVLMDTSSLSPSHLLRYHIYATKTNEEGFINDHLNDCRTCTFDQEQRWVVPDYHWAPPVGAVFRTMFTPHTSSTLVGEEISARLYMRLVSMMDDVGGNLPTICADWEQQDGSMYMLREDIKKLVEQEPNVHHAVRQSLQDMLGTYESVRTDLCSASSNASTYLQNSDDGQGDKKEDMRKALERCLLRNTRMSMELRAVAITVTSRGLIALATTALITILIGSLRK